VTSGVLLMVVPWVLFAVSVATIGVLVMRRRATDRQRLAQQPNAVKRANCRPMAGAPEVVPRPGDKRD
jgi:hypothetical protein